MKRYIYQELIDWKHKIRRKPLVVRGARQVGKTFCLKQFGQQEFTNLVYIDLERHPEWHTIFSGDLSAVKICQELEIVSGCNITPGESLLFIDEIQSCPRAIMALRYFYEDFPWLHVVAAGSLLEFALQDISFPVGRIQSLHLSPMTFGEYLVAAGYEQAAEIITEAPRELSEASHALLTSELRKYFFVGGMPESIKAFIETGSMQEAFDVQEEICQTYYWDFAKYKPRVNHICLHQVLASISKSIGQQVKYSRLSDSFSNPTIKKAFELLNLANLIYKVSSVDPSGIPLQSSSSDKIFKTILVDIGLMRCLNKMQAGVEYMDSNLLHIYKGAMAEQFVGQELLAQNKGCPPYYWSRRAKSSTAEVDYLTVIDNEIYPIEVKSGASGSLKSLHLCLNRYKKCPQGLIFSDRPYQILPEQGFVFLPLYYAGGMRVL